MTAVASVYVIDDIESAATVLHPLRLKLLAALDTPDSAAGLARRLRMPRQKINYHLRELAEQGLVVDVGEQQKRGCTERLVRAVARSYVINPLALGDVATDPSRESDRRSVAYLVAIAAQMIRELAALRARATATSKRLPTLTVQTEIRFATPERQREFADELAAELARLVAKYHDDAAENGRRFRVFAASYPAPAANNPT